MIKSTTLIDLFLVTMDGNMNKEGTKPVKGMKGGES